MSAEGFHVHGPHDHELEHAAQGAHGGDGFSGKIAVMTAILATVGALFGYQGGATQNAALLFNLIRTQYKGLAPRFAFTAPASWMTPP